MHNWSLVCFTLLCQGAIGLVWVALVGRWFGGESQITQWYLLLSLVLIGLGLYAALGHLAKPRLAPQALRNLTKSWLSREVLSVQAFAGVVALLMLLAFFNVLTGRVLLEITACLLGGAALMAMARVYALKTVPVWNSSATPLEFAGSALLIGGILGLVMTIVMAGEWIKLSPIMVVIGVSVLLGLILKLLAVSPALKAEQVSKAQTWYEPAKVFPSFGQVLTLRLGLSLAGLGLIVAAMGETGPTWLWSSLALGCLAASEVLGRWRFYRAYNRVGL